MTRLLAILLVGLGGLSLGAAPASARPDVTGAMLQNTTTWRGTLDAGSAQLRLEIQITEEPGEKRSGRLKSLDQNDATFELAEIRATSDSLSFTIPALSASYRGKRRADRGVVDGIFAQSGAELPLVLTSSASADPPSEQPQAEGRLLEAWVGELNMGLMKPVMQFRIVARETGDTVAFFDSVTEGRTGFPATRSIRGDTLAFDVPRIRLTFRGKLDDAGQSAEGIWAQGGREVPLELTRQDHVYDDANVWAKRPQRPVGPFPYESEEVSFENREDGVTLAGTLTIPETPGRHPAVVLISGSGPQDRDETLMEHKPFLVLADYLGRRGIAVLRYDDRGTARSTGRFGLATTEDFARDASAAVEFLKGHSRIDPKEIGLAGHSEGGLVAPMVNRLRDDLAFVVLLAATGVDGATVSLNQSETALRAAGTDEAEIQRALVLNRAIFDAGLRARSDAEFEQLIEPAIQAAAGAAPEAQRAAATAAIRQGVRNGQRRMRTAWMRFFLTYDPRPALRDLEVPVLAISGTKDVQVVPELNEPEIRKALTEGGNRDFEIVRMDGLNHMFQLAGTGSMDEYRTIQETFNPAALERIGDWIVAHTTPIH